VGRRHCQAGAMSTVQSITPLAAASAASLAAPHVSWDEALAPDALDLVVLFRGQSLSRKPHASAELKGDELAAAQAAWDAAETHAEEKANQREAQANGSAACAQPAAVDFARRVEQRRNDVGQQQAHRGTCPSTDPPPRAIEVMCYAPRDVAAAHGYVAFTTTENPHRSDLQHLHNFYLCRLPRDAYGSRRHSTTAYPPLAVCRPRLAASWR